MAHVPAHHAPRQAAWRPVLVVLALCVAAAALQANAPAIKLKQRKTKDLVSYQGFVQVYSHTAITVRDPHNMYALRTFTYAPQLRQKLLNKHLDYNQPVTVVYRVKDEVAVQVKGKWKQGN